MESQLPIGIDPSIFKNIGRALRSSYLQPTCAPFQYQLASVAWMLFRETHEWYGVLGGINGQAMGLGKTLQSLLLILADRLLYHETPTLPLTQQAMQRALADARRNPIKTNDDGVKLPRYHPATLVVAGKEARRAWIHSIDSHIQPGKIRFMTVKSLQDLNSIPDDVHIVFISTGIIDPEACRRANFNAIFRRMIFDEAHDGCNATTNLARGIYLLPSIFRWGLSATLFINSGSDFLSVLHNCLRMKEPRLLNWASRSSPTTNAARLEEQGLDMVYIDNAVLGLALCRSRTTNNQPYTIHERSPSQLYGALLCVPVSLRSPIRGYLQTPTRAWEWCELTNPQTNTQLAHVNQIFYEYVRHCGQRPGGEFASNVHIARADQATLCMARHLGHIISSDTNITLSKRLKGIGNVYSAQQAALPIASPDRAFFRLLMFGIHNGGGGGGGGGNELLSPSHQQLIDGINISQALQHPHLWITHHYNVIQKRATQLLDSYKLTETCYDALMQGVSKPGDAINDDSSSTADIVPNHIILFVRRVGRHSDLEQEALRVMRSNAVRCHTTRINSDGSFIGKSDNKSGSGADNILAHFAASSESAIHPDVLLATREDKALALIPSDSRLYGYYKKTWQSAVEASSRPLDSTGEVISASEWIARTAHTRIVSTKMRMLAEYLYTSVLPDERVIVFGRFNAALSILNAFVRDRLQIKSCVIFGSHDNKTRELALQSMSKPEGPRVFFISTQGFSQSGNMTDANHVIHLQTWWNAIKDDQGRGRVDRPGQTRPIYHSAFLLAESIDVAMRICAHHKEELRRVTEKHNDVVYVDIDDTQPVSSLRIMAHPSEFTKPLVPPTIHTNDEAHQGLVADNNRSTSLDPTKHLRTAYKSWRQAYHHASHTQITLAPRHFTLLDRPIEAYSGELQWELNTYSIGPMDIQGVDEIDDRNQTTTHKPNTITPIAQSTGPASYISMAIGQLAAWE